MPAIYFWDKDELVTNILHLFNDLIKFNQDYNKKFAYLEKIFQILGMFLLIFIIIHWY